MPKHGFDHFLRAARRRRWLQILLCRTALGATLGCGIGLFFISVHLARPIPQLYGVVFLVVCGAAVVGLGKGLMERPSLMKTALLMDSKGRFKDRIHSALQLQESQPANPYRELLRQDAARVLEGQLVGTLLPWRWPREGTWAGLGTTFLLVVTALLPNPRSAEATWAEPPRAVSIEASQLQEDIEDLAEVAEELDSEEVRELANRLKEILSTMEDDAKDAHEAMFELARMTVLTEAAIGEFDSVLLQQSMMEIGQGLSALDGFKPSAEMLKQGKFDQASEALQRLGQQIGDGAMTLPASGGLAQAQMGKLAQQAKAAGLKDLSQALNWLQQAIKSGSGKECQGALSQLSATIRKYGRRAKIGRAMRSQLAKLGQCKSRMSKYCQGCKGGGKCSGGKCAGNGKSMGLGSLGLAQSDSPSQGVGTKSSMNLFGKQTELRSNRTEAQVSSHHVGQGDSDVETTSSPDGRQNGIREYRKAYAEFRKLSDAMMTEEAIPLAHRQVIKTYFELIHPDRVETDLLVREASGTQTNDRPLGLEVSEE